MDGETPPGVPELAQDCVPWRLPPCLPMRQRLECLTVSASSA